MFQEYSIDLIINREMGQIVIFDSDDVPYVESDNDEDGTAHFEIKNQEQVFFHTRKNLSLRNKPIDCLHKTSAIVANLSLLWRLFLF